MITIFTMRVRVCGGRYVGVGVTLGTTSYISGKTMDKFQCTWITMIGKIYELIVEYLRNGFK